MSNLPIQIKVTDTETGEIREWSMSRRGLRMIVRALKAHRDVPAYIAMHFIFPGPRR